MLNDSDLEITHVEIKDIRFPTSNDLDGSDAMNLSPDYSAATVILHTTNSDLQGHGMTFTLGRGNEICVKAIESLQVLIVGQKLTDIICDMGKFWKHMTGDSQLRWIGPEKGAIHLATAAIINAVWDLWAKYEKKPLWKLVSDMSPEQLVSCIDFSYICDALTPEEAIEILKSKELTKKDRESQLLIEGYPAYTTSAGWMGYSDDKIRTLLQSSIKTGWKSFKLKVGSNLQDDIRRMKIVREEIGPDGDLMIDANQVWSVDEAVEWVKELAQFNPYFIEEPTSPDDILGHLAIKNGIKPIKVATGEHCHNRVMFKQFFQAQAIDVCQLDSCRLGGVNEVLAVLLMAAKFDIPVCPHAGGVGLSEHVQHLSMIDYICISGSLKGRMIEYVDHLHEYFKYPCEVKNGAYLPPLSPGFSTEMLGNLVEDFEFPDGKVWK
jgi:L-fuconate dehydratase|tara:strand:+ start:2952 stop:4259 length:1308 start_codon:yes stop_codon:yes gene_type:complete